MSEKDPAEHFDMLLYFWEEKGDLERYYYWEELLPRLRSEYPEVVKAWEDYKTARRTISAVLNGVKP